MNEREKIAVKVEELRNLREWAELTPTKRFFLLLKEETKSNIETLNSVSRGTFRPEDIAMGLRLQGALNILEAYNSWPDDQIRLIEAQVEAMADNKRREHGRGA